MLAPGPKMCCLACPVATGQTFWQTVPEPKQPHPARILGGTSQGNWLATLLCSSMRWLHLVITWWISIKARLTEWDHSQILYRCHKTSQTVITYFMWGIAVAFMPVLDYPSFLGGPAWISRVPLPLRWFSWRLCPLVQTIGFLAVSKTSVGWCLKGILQTNILGFGIARLPLATIH